MKDRMISLTIRYGIFTRRKEKIEFENRELETERLQVFEMVMVPLSRLRISEDKLIIYLADHRAPGCA